jgi:hypothetical protein
MRRLSLAALLLTCAVSYPAHATIVEALDTRGLVNLSDRIVRGHVVSQVAAWDDAHQRIWTDVTIRIDETYKGTPAGATLLIRRQGGSVAGIGMRTIGEVEFANGEEVFLFLRRVPLKSGEIHQTIGMAQGKLRIVRDANGTRVIADPRGANLMTRGADGRARIQPGAPSIRSLADLEHEVKQLAGERR